MEKEKIKQVTAECLEHIFQEMKRMSAKQSWSAGEHEMFGKMLDNMEKAVCIMQRVEGEEGYSGRRGYSMDSRNGDAGYGRFGNYRADRGDDNMYSERARAVDGQNAPVSMNEYSGHSVDDRVIAMLEEMAGNAGSDYERNRINDKIEMLRRAM